MKQILLTVFTLFRINGFAQTDTKTYNFNHKIFEVVGDLNKDGLSDKVIVTQDTINDNAPYRLQIFFKDTSGRFNLIITSTKIIEPQYLMEEVDILLETDSLM